MFLWWERQTGRGFGEGRADVGSCQVFLFETGQGRLGLEGGERGNIWVFELGFPSGQRRE